MDDFEQLDYYALLGIAREASADELKRAYRRQMALFHPDRFAGAPPEEQTYAGRRAQRINEAYAVLGDFSARLAYNRTLTAGRPASPTSRQARAGAPPPPPRDHLAELYDQAQAHLAAGRQLQAAATLREILQLNPFYRDSAALLARAEAAAARRPPAPSLSPSDRERRMLMLGGLGAVLLAGLGAAGWAIRRPLAGSSQATPAAVGMAPTVASPTAAPTVAPPTAAPTAVPPTAAPPTAVPPTAAPPVAPPTAAPPTAAPPTAAPPTASPTPAGLAEQGQLLYAEDFRAGTGWPSLSGRGWSVGFAADGYQITAGDGAGNIWAYSTSPAGADYLIGVDVQVSGGLGGLLLRFRDGAYLAFFINPDRGSYRLEQRAGAGERVLIEEANDAIAVGPAASNRLVARLEGENLALRINGQPTAELSLTAPPPSPLYGMVAVARGTGVTATFRNLSIRAL
jgi:hypothetical protein